MTDQNRIYRLYLIREIMENEGNMGQNEDNSNRNTNNVLSTNQNSVVTINTRSGAYGYTIENINDEFDGSVNNIIRALANGVIRNSHSTNTEQHGENINLSEEQRINQELSNELNLIEENYRRELNEERNIETANTEERNIETTNTEERNIETTNNEERNIETTNNDNTNNNRNIENNVNRPRSSTMIRSLINYISSLSSNLEDEYTRSTRISENNTEGHTSHTQEPSVNQQSSPDNQLFIFDFIINGVVYSVEFQRPEVGLAETILFFDNIFFTREQVRKCNRKMLKKLKRFRISSKHTKEECTICMNNYKIRELARCLPCHHIFHSKCVDRWLTTHNGTCPICRKSVVN